MSRRLRAALRGSIAAVPLLLPAGPLAITASAQEEPPRTGFEESGGARWTTHDEEVEFLAAVGAGSERVSITEIGRTLQDRPLHLVEVGHPGPQGVNVALSRPTLLTVCTQHGNEPAGREACLQTIRDLAFASDPGLVDLISRQTFLFVPTANPDGRAANSRGNSTGTDINRDHITLNTAEGRAIAAVVRDWEPDMSLDLHEYGPSVPVLYDDEILYLWPRNLNVDRRVQDLARSFARGHIEPCAEEAGYTADEYGLYKVADTQVRQTAGDEDDGIMRNAMGLRHSLGILIETAVSPDPTNGPGEITTAADNMNRRVDAHLRVLDCTLDFMRERGIDTMVASRDAARSKQGEGLAMNQPVYWFGADNDPSAPDEQLFPPPCSYRLSPAQAAEMEDAFQLMGIHTIEGTEATVVPLGQEAEPVIPLMLDGRARRDSVQAEPTFEMPLTAACGAGEMEQAGGGPEPTTTGAWMVGGLLSLVAGMRLLRRTA